MAKNLFGGLVKFVGNQAGYDGLDKTGGKLIFAEIKDGDDVVARYIYANGIEYKIADASDFDGLKERVKSLEDWSVLADASIDALQAKDVEIDASIDELQAKDAEIDASIDALQAKDVEIDASIDDLQARVEDLEEQNPLVDASLTTVIGTNEATVTLGTEHFDGTTASEAFSVAGEGYVTVGGTNSAIEVAVTTASVASAATAGEGLADAKDVKDYVDAQVQTLEQALVFKGAADELTDLPADSSAGWTYVATAAFTIPATQSVTGVPETVENGDLIIANDEDKWITVQRNLDGAVMADDALDSSKLVVGQGGQKVATIDVTEDELTEAIDKASTAVQSVTGTTSTDEYVDITTSGTTDVTVTVDVTVADVSTAAATGEGLADAKDVKDYVDWKVDSIPEVEMTLDSSTPAYVTTSATVSDGAITATVGVITATLENASNGSIGLAMAEDVYARLAEVEEVMATANTTMAGQIGLNPDGYTPLWTAGGPIAADTSIVKAIELVAEQAAQSGVTEFGGAKGAISIATASDATHNVVFEMGGVDGSTLLGNVDLSSIEQRIADVSQHAIDNDASIVDLKAKDVEIDSSIDALQAKDVEIDASIDRIDASIADHEARLDAIEAQGYVNSVEGEAVIADASKDYVYVNANPTNGDVKLESGVVLASFTPDAAVTPATANGLATDALVKDYVEDRLLWEVIGA